MRVLTAAEHERDVAPLIASLLDDPAGFEPFSDALPCRLYMDDVVFELDEEEFIAFHASVAATGDSSYFLTCLEEPYSAVVDVSEGEAGYYAAGAPIALLEALLVSPAGQWAVLMPDLPCAVAAGSEAFVNDLRRRLPPHRVGLAALDARRIRAEHSGLSTGWIPPLRRHLASRDCGPPPTS